MTVIMITNATFKNIFSKVVKYKCIN